MKIFFYSATLWKPTFWKSSVFIIFSLTDLFLPWGLVSGPSQNLLGPLYILFISGTWTLNSLGSVVNNRETWYVFQCLFCLAVTDSPLGMAASHTGCGQFYWSQQASADSGTDSFCFLDFSRDLQCITI